MPCTVSLVGFLVDRQTWKIDFSAPSYLHNNRERVEEAKANAVSSHLVHAPGLHAPAVDIDHPCRVVRSSTPGHSHLYIDVPMPWWKYRILLRVLVFVGLVERGYYRASVKQKGTFLRKPGVYKDDADRTHIQVSELLEIVDDLDQS